MNTFKLIRDISENMSLDRSEVIEMIRAEDIQIETYERAEEIAEEYILESLWAFRPEFLLSYMPEGMTIEAIQAIQEKYEAANEPLKSLVGDEINSLVSDAIGCDGLGHFLSSYDGNNYEYMTGSVLYTYWRTN